MTGLVVIGVGNDFRSDDGAGLAVLRRLMAADHDGVRLIELDGEPARMVAAWTDAALAVVVDASRSGSPPGTVRRLERLDALGSVGSAGSSHSLGVAAAVELGRSLGELPGRLVVYAIEGSDFSPGTEMSPAVERAVDDVVAEIVSRYVEAAHR